MIPNPIPQAEHRPVFEPKSMPHSGQGHIDLPARFDVMSSVQYRMPFSRLLADPNIGRLVVNLSEVTYIDSSGIGTLIAWHKTCGEHGKALVMQNCGNRVMDTFKMLAVDRLFSFL